MNSEAGKKVAMEKWARRNLGRGYFVASEDVEPVDERPPESLHEKVNGLVAVELRRMVGAMVEKRGVGSLACGEIYRLLDTKFPGIKGSKFSGLAKQLLGDSEVSRILGVFDDSGPCVLG